MVITFLYIAYVIWKNIIYLKKESLLFEKNIIVTEKKMEIIWKCVHGYNNKKWREWSKRTGRKEWRSWSVFRSEYRVDEYVDKTQYIHTAGSILFIE